MSVAEVKIDRLTRVPGPEQARIGDPLTQADFDALEKSWLRTEDVERAMIRRVDDATSRDLLGRNGRAGEYQGLAFPYVLPGNDHVREHFVRRDRPDIEFKNGKQRERQKYVGPPGRSNLAYFVPGTASESLADTKLPVAITEGAKKAIALQRLAEHNGSEPCWLPLGLNGVWNFRGTIGKQNGPNGERRDVKGVISDLELITWTDRLAFVVFDANAQSDISVQRARRELAFELRERGATVRFVEIPDRPGVNGVDDLLYLDGPEAVLDLFENAADGGRPEVFPFKIAPSGVYFLDADPDKEPIKICSRLDVVAYTRDDDREDWGRFLHWRDPEAHEHQWAMPMRLLAGDGAECRSHLLDGGLQIYPGRRAKEKLIEFLQTAPSEERLRCVPRIGWHGERFVLPDTSIGPETAEAVVYQSPRAVEQRLRIEATTDEWREHIGSLCAGNSLLVVTTSCAFAGPLLNLVDSESGGIHLVGASSTGKTTALAVAGSVWGGGPNGYVHTWRTTLNGLEAIAEHHNDGLLCLDEVAQLDPREAAETAYMLANGQGKARMTKSIGARQRLSWRLLFLSAGEISIADHAGSIGKRVRAGAEIRLVNLVADAGQGMGIFECLHDAESADAFARQLKEASQRYYGAPIRHYLEQLTSEREDLAPAFKAFQMDFVGRCIPENSCGEVSRVAGRFALLAFAGELATRFGITGWPEGQATEASERWLRSWLESRESSGSGDDEAAVRQVRMFIEKHGASRFQSMTPRYTSGGDQVQERIIERAGFRSEESDDGDKGVYLFLAEVFRAEVCRGFNPNQVARALADRGYLECEKGKHLTVRRTLPEVGKTRVYAVKSSVLGGEKQ